MNNNHSYEKPRISKYFKIDNLVEQPVYVSKNLFRPIYVNKELYEKIFNKEYTFNDAMNDISNMFSLTLDVKNSSDGKEIEKAYVDMQYDPLNISMDGNIGSGRAFFYKKEFNIKGDKTKLATSTKSEYNNGKYSLSNAIRETIISNVLADDFEFSTFKTLAILDKNENYNFSIRVFGKDGVTERKINLPCSMIVRVNEDKLLYRFTNAFSNNDLFSEREIRQIAIKMGESEASKFIDRFLHGAWSCGNMSTEINQIDFEGSFFVKGRFPQYSVTPWFKSNYFGNELTGQLNIIKALIEGSSENSSVNYIDIEKITIDSYNKKFKEKFCDLIGLNFDDDYHKYKEKIDFLSKSFNELSKFFLPNYSSLNVLEDTSNNTFLFDFSNYFRFYLIHRLKGNYNEYDNLLLILNKSIRFDNDFNQNIIDEVNKQFKNQMIIDDEKMNTAYGMISIFIREYESLFDEVISNSDDIDNIIMKSYIINEDRKYLFGNINIGSVLTNEYMNGELSSNDLNTIISTIIELNKRKFYYNKNEYLTNLVIYKDCITYFIIGKGYFYFTIKMLRNNKVNSVKIIINNNEYILKHNNKNDIFITEKIYDDDCYDTILQDIEIIFNGVEYEKRLI